MQSNDSAAAIMSANGGGGTIGSTGTTSGGKVLIEERMHKHIAKKKIWPKETTNPLAGGDGWQPRQKVHYTQHNAHTQQSVPVPVPAAPVASAQPLSLPALSPSKPPSSKPTPAPIANVSNTAAATAAVTATSSGAAPIRVGIVPGLDGAEGRKTGLRTVKPLPANTKSVRPRKTAAPSTGSTLATTSSLTDAAIPTSGAAAAGGKPAGKRVFTKKFQTNSEEATIESAVGHRYRGYTTEEKRNGIGPGGDRGFTAVEFSDRFFESGGSGPGAIRWVPTKQQRAAQKLKDHYTQAGEKDTKTNSNGARAATATGTGTGSAAATASGGGAGSRFSRTGTAGPSITAPAVSPSKAQQARAAAEQAAINAILTRKTYEQKLEEEERAADIALVGALPDTLATNTIGKGADRENPSASALLDGDDSD